MASQKIKPIISVIAVVIAISISAALFISKTDISRLPQFLKKLLPKDQALTLTANINLSPTGDINQNAQIDSGDTVTFTYTITNNTDNEHPFATLITNIPRNYIHFIHNINGAASLSDENGIVAIPNLYINPQQKLVVSFEARINYFQGEQYIFTEPQLISQHQENIAQAKKLSKRITPIPDQEFSSMTQTKKK